MAAEQGHADAQYKLANLYIKGDHGIVQNFEKANKWFKEAVNNGCIQAQYNYGLWAFKERGMPQNLEHARQWFKQTSSDIPDANYYLGVMYFKGKGFEKNMEKALNYLKVAVKLSTKKDKAQEMINKIEESMKEKN